MFAYLFLKFASTPIINYESADIAATLHHSHNNGLVLAASAGNDALALVLVHETRFATDEGLINFDFARQLSSILALHCKSDAMEHEPRSLLSYAYGAMNLPRTNPVLTVCDHPHSSQPLVETKRRIFKDRPALDGELPTVVAFVTLPAVVLWLKDYVLGSTTRADDAFTPTASYDVLAAVGRIGEVDNRFLKGGWLHTSSVT